MHDMPARDPKHAASTKRHKAERRHRRSDRDSRAHGWQIASMTSGPVGPGVVIPSMDDVMAAMAALPTRLDWATLGPDVLPVLPRLRPLPPGSPDPVQILVPPGIPVRFGVDAGPMFLSVHQGMLDDWDLGPAELLASALDNLRRRAADVRVSDVASQRVGGVTVRALQSGTSSGSALVLAPDELVRLFGADPQVLVAPMRDLLLSLPLDADPALAWDLYDVFASQDPSCLPPMAFALRDGRVTVEPLEPDATGPWPGDAGSPSRHH
jgi:hypothetical protein